MTNRRRPSTGRHADTWRRKQHWCYCHYYKKKIFPSDFTNSCQNGKLPTMLNTILLNKIWLWTFGIKTVELRSNYQCENTIKLIFQALAFCQTEWLMLETSASWSPHGGNLMLSNSNFRVSLPQQDNSTALLETKPFVCRCEYTDDSRIKGIKNSKLSFLKLLMPLNYS